MIVLVPKIPIKSLLNKIHIFLNRPRYVFLNRNELDK